MPVKICPNCGVRYVIGFDVTDFVHECNSSNPAIDQEDIVVIGNWEDYSGVGSVPPQQVLMQGAENKLFGTRADIEDMELHDVTPRGARKSTHRQRQRFEFINFKPEGLD